MVSRSLGVAPRLLLGASSLLILVLAVPGHGVEPRTAPVAGLRDNTPQTHALVGAKIVTAPGKVIEIGTVVLRDGLITAVGAEVNVPQSAVVWDMAGRTIYAGFIDAGGEQELDVKRSAVGGWNDAVRPYVRLDEHYAPVADVNKRYRSQGVAVRVVAPSQGIIKGTSAAVATGDDSPTYSVVSPQTALHLQLEPAVGSEENFPGSPMGAYTLVRQTLLDGVWYARALEVFRTNPAAPRPETNDGLIALNEILSRKLPIVVSARNWHYFFRADALGREFDLPIIVHGAGDEYQRLDAVRASGRAVIVPLNFAGAPNVANAEAALTVSLEQLMHWDMAPENPGRLAAAGVRIALTSRRLKLSDSLLGQVRKAVERGLTADDALKALTVTPAKLFGLDKRYGTIEVGKTASLVVADGDLFTNPKAKVIDTWVEGRRYEVQPRLFADLRGRWDFTIPKQGGGTEELSLTLEGEAEKLTGKLTRAKKDATLKNVAMDGAQWSAALKGDALEWKGEVQISAAVLTARDDVREDAPGLKLDGFLLLPHGERVPFQAKHTVLETKKKPTHVKADDEARAALYPVNYPFGDFGLPGVPAQPNLLAFTNATVWTCGPAGKLEGATVVVAAGKIQAVGKNVTVPNGAVIVDCQGKHLSPGIIDCHSHVATDGGVNESTQSITAEVRVGDFIEADDINIYRQMAGGVTSSNILHGSANTIGGQNQVVKFRWGALPEEMKFAAAPPGIKFALGENVKRSNWGSSSRYPQTRMGVEQLLRDAFKSAEDYRRRWKEYRSFKRGLPPRTDLELEALVEVIEGKRLIHCHSYRQDEILAFLRVCEEFHVRVATLQHILEGYKVADVMAKHGAGGSSFSDWWAYKFEVYDAIPYNGAIMHDRGVVVSFNSDDAELARRLNLEAAKAVKYGGVSPEEALKFVTLNPAKQLGIDKYVGSIEPGKDADLVVWNTSPLSTMSRCEQTWIDGRKYFDRADDLRRRDETLARRNNLIQRVLASGEPIDTSPDAEKKPMWARDDIYCGCRSPHIRLGQAQQQQGN
jgi:N-acetylglucosamine-6-phosphate deacetylase